ncbi:MAG: Crp/Fnr family transcriptional regulator [Bacteroidota bacterium]
MSFTEYISSVISISKLLEKEITTISKKITVSKGHNLISIDDRCNNLYFIEKGLIRGYYFVDGKEITNWFAQESEFATCFYAFIASKPSFEIIQTIEECELIELNYSALQDLYKRFPETERIGRMITENYYIKLEERILNLQFKTAKERYQKLVSSRPSLLQRASLGQVASYLGITQETLSRIRAEL